MCIYLDPKESLLSNWSCFLEGWPRDRSLHFMIISHITNIFFMVCIITQNWCQLHYRGLECKSRKSSDTWNNRQIWPWSTKWSREKANRVLPREHTGHSKHPLSTTQEKALHMDITRWSILKSDWLYSLQLKMETLYTELLAKTRLGADYGSDHEFLITKFRLKLKKVGKTTRPFRYDLNQIPYRWQIYSRD